MNSRRTLAWIGLLAAIGASCVLPAYAVDCREDPWSCPKGTTCWLSDDPLQYVCLEKGGKSLGESCASEVGVADCGEGLLCVFDEKDKTGSCLPFCDQGEHDCKNGECGDVRMQVEGEFLPPIHACKPK